MSEVFLSFKGKQESALCAQTQIPSFFFDSSSQAQLNSLKFNALLRSDNLLALKTLESLQCQFDVIYIDPPYNSSSQLTFQDSHQNESHWLSMMYPRLILAKKVLNEEGLFFISIDDRQMATLTVLLKEIFGAENHVGTIKWRKKRKPSFLGKHFSNVIEYILVFSKNKNKLLKLKGPLTEDKTRPVLNASNAIVNRTLLKGTPATCKDGIYPAGVHKNRTLSFETFEDAVIKNNVLLNDVPVKGPFRVNQTILNNTVFITNNFGLRRKVLDSEKTFKHATDDATVNYESNDDGETQLKKLFAGEKIFEYPKPVGLIKNLIKMFSSDKETISCLDFFAGTATLAQAVHELNLEKLKNKYIFCCIQSEEEILSRPQIKFGEFKTIADIAQARIQVIEETYQIFPKCKIFSPKV